MIINPQCSRRTLFTGSGVVAGAAWLGGPPLGAAHAAEEAVSALEPVRYEPAALTAAVRGSAYLGRKVYMASRHNVGEGIVRLGVVDPMKGEVLETQDLDLGARSGNNAMAADDQYLYIGPAGSQWVWRYDPATKTAEPFFEIGTATTWTYAMRVVGEYLYVGNYPHCELFKVSLATGEATAFGRVGTSQYTITVDADEEIVAAVTAAPGAVKVYDHEGVVLHDLTEFLEASPVGVLDLVISEGLLYISCGRFIITMRPDGSERVVRPIAEEDRYIDKLCVLPDGRVLALARLTTNYYEVTSTGLAHLGQPWHSVENQGFFPDGDGRLVGVTGLGHVWNAEVGGESAVYPTAHSPFGVPEPVQSLLAHTDGSVWAAGHFAITIHHAPRDNAESPSSEFIEVNGEPKSMVETSDGTVVAGMYPSTSVMAISPDGQTQKLLGVIDNDQMRPLAMAYDAARGVVVIPSTAKHRIHTGAITFANPTTGAFEVRRDLLPDQNLRNISIEGDFAYLGGDTYAEAKDEQGPATVASIIELDLRTREVVREMQPQDWASYEDVLVVDGVLYALGRRPRGAWFAMDLATEEVLASGNLAEAGALSAHDGRVFYVSQVRQQIIELGVDDGGSETVIFDGLDLGFYNRPEPSGIDGEPGFWGVDRMALTWFPLAPLDETPPTVDAWFEGKRSGHVTIEATDDGSGVASIEYRLGSGAWTVYEGPVPVDRHPHLVMQYRATDEAGNVSEVTSLALRPGPPVRGRR